MRGRHRKLPAAACRCENAHFSASVEQTQSCTTHAGSMLRVLYTGGIADGNQGLFYDSIHRLKLSAGIYRPISQSTGYWLLGCQFYQDGTIPRFDANEINIPGSKTAILNNYLVIGLINRIYNLIVISHILHCTTAYSNPCAGLQHFRADQKYSLLFGYLLDLYRFTFFDQRRCKP
jgi:hypothetical protein